MLVGNMFFFIVIGFLILMVVKHTIEIAFTLENYGIHKRRMEQLKREADKKDLSTVEQMDKYTASIREHLFPRLRDHLPSLRMENLEQLQKDIDLIGWDDTFTPETFIATGIGLKIIGIFMFIFSLGLIKGPFKIIAILVSVAFMFALDYMFKSETSALKSKLFSEFPDFIRIVSGYLSAGVTLVDAISDSVKYVGIEWKPILQQFVVDCDTKSVNIALNNMKDTVDLFEVKEFVALVRLTLEQGGNVKEGFISQAAKIGEMQKNALIIKVGKRKTMSTMLQAPLLLANIVILALPTVGNMLDTF